MSKLPILMYHNVVDDDDSKSINLGISKKKIEAHFKFLFDNNYKTFRFKDLDSLQELPKKCVILTFDDVTECQFIYAVPLLKKYKLKASFFIPFSFVGNFDYWIEGKEK